MDPDESVDTFMLVPRDVYFIPASYPHQIEVVGDNKIHFLIFFDQPMPKGGFRQAGAALGRRSWRRCLQLRSGCCRIFLGLRRIRCW